MILHVKIACLRLCLPPPYGVEEEEEEEEKSVRVVSMAIASNLYFRLHPKSNSRMNAVKV